MKIEIAKLNCDTLCMLFNTAHNIEQYYKNTVEDDEIATEYAKLKVAINTRLAEDSLSIVYINGEWAVNY